jgi:hypothetical protein
MLKVKNSGGSGQRKAEEKLKKEEPKKQQQQEPVSATPSGSEGTPQKAITLTEL